MQRSYSEVEGVNNTSLGWLAVSPYHYRKFLESPPEPTAAMKLGIAIHMYVLEQERFEKTYHVLQHDGRTREGKAERQEAEGKELITVQQLESIQDITKSLIDSGAYDLLLQGETEVSKQWSDESTGIKCKGRADAVFGNSIVDLKTTQDIKSWASKFRYGDLDRQAAFYLDGFCAQSFEWVVAETVYPFGIQIFRASAETIERGRRKYQDLLLLLQECRIQNRWQYFNEIKEI